MKNYQVLQEALDKATQRGSFNLQETSYIMTALQGVHKDLQELEQLKQSIGAAKKAVSPEQPELKPKK